MKNACVDKIIFIEALFYQLQGKCQKITHEDIEKALEITEDVLR